MRARSLRQTRSLRWFPRAVDFVTGLANLPAGNLTGDDI